MGSFNLIMKNRSYSYYLHKMVWLLILLICSCTPAGRKERFDLHKPIIKLKNSYVITGKASHYSSDFNGNRTASGERYNSRRLTAAHKTLPFGTRVEVCNLKNNLKVCVTINDRGPHKADRILDLSQAAFQELGGGDSGLIEVEARILP